MDCKYKPNCKFFHLFYTNIKTLILTGTGFLAASVPNLLRLPTTAQDEIS